MPRNNKTPDAWDDDDWETQADQMRKVEEAPAEQTPMPRTERLARHAEAQRKLWESAYVIEPPSDAPPSPYSLPANQLVYSDTPQENLFVVANSNNIPLATNFKPAMKLLSRKPAPQMIARRDPVTGIEQLTLQDDDEEEDDAKKAQPTPEEIRMRQQRELEEKQRRYDEARAKIFGGSGASSGQSSPGNVTPPSASDGRQTQRKQPRGRGGGYRGDSRPEGRQDSHSRRVPAGSQTSPRELYDPNFSSKPGAGSTAKREGESGSPRPGRSLTPREEDQVIRAPIGPDSSGRGGFKFAKRGAKDG